MIQKDNVKPDTIRLASRCITNNKQKEDKVNVAKIINDTMTRKKKKVIHKTRASICQRSKATSVIIGLSSAWLYCLMV